MHPNSNFKSMFIVYVLRGIDTLSQALLHAQEARCLRQFRSEFELLAYAVEYGMVRTIFASTASSSTSAMTDVPGVYV
jgi:hypothetical protein